MEEGRAGENEREGSDREGGGEVVGRRENRRRGRVGMQSADINASRQSHLTF